MSTSFATSSLPATHAVDHQPAGADAMAVNAAAGTGSLRTLGTTATSAAAGDHTTPAATATVGGHVPTPPNNTTTFYRGDGTFATVPAGASAATAQEVEDNTSTTTYVSPGRAGRHPSAAKAWVSITATNGLGSPSLNISSITNTGAGNRTINFTTAFSGAGPGGVYGGASARADATSAERHHTFATQNVGSIIQQVRDSGGVLIDGEALCCFFGDQ